MIIILSTDVVKSMKNEEYKKHVKKIKDIEKIKNRIMEGNFSLALKEIEYFLKDNPDDAEVLYLYGKTLRKSGRVEEAIIALNQFLSKCIREKKTHYVDATRVELFKVYFINDYYEEAYRLLSSVSTILASNPDYSVEILTKILEIKLGIYQNRKDGEPNAIYYLLHYNKEKALEHIKNNQLQVEARKYPTFKDIDLAKLFSLVEEFLPNSQKVQSLASKDVYLFTFPNIGGSGYHNLKVVTNKGTYEIITMYPTSTDYKYYVNQGLCEEYLKRNTSKQKIKSQIEKFYSRYPQK